jgi:hypothetical protein
VNESLLLTLLSLLTIGLMIASMASARSQRPSELRRQAEEKGLALLSSWFTPEQAAQWMSRREFDVVGSDTGTRYRITTKPGGMNIHELEWCVGALVQQAWQYQGTYCSHRRLPWRPRKIRHVPSRIGSELSNPAAGHTAYKGKVATSSQRGRPLYRCAGCQCRSCDEALGHRETK